MGGADFQGSIAEQPRQIGRNAALADAAPSHQAPETTTMQPNTNIETEPSPRASELIKVHPRTARARFSGPTLVVEVVITARDPDKYCTHQGLATWSQDCGFGSVTWDLVLPAVLSHYTSWWSVRDAIVPHVREAATELLNRIVAAGAK